MSRVEEKRRGVLLLPSIEGEVGRDGHTLGTKAQGALGDGVRKNILFLQTGRSGLGIELGLRGSGHSCKWSNKDNIKLIFSACRLTITLFGKRLISFFHAF